MVMRVKINNSKRGRKKIPLLLLGELRCRGRGRFKKKENAHASGSFCHPGNVLIVGGTWWGPRVSSLWSL